MLLKSIRHFAAVTVAFRLSSLYRWHRKTDGRVAERLSSTRCRHFHFI